MYIYIYFGPPKYFHKSQFCHVLLNVFIHWTMIPITDFRNTISWCFTRNNNIETQFIVWQGDSHHQNRFYGQGIERPRLFILNAIPKQPWCGPQFPLQLWLHLGGHVFNNGKCIYSGRMYICKSFIYINICTYICIPQTWRYTMWKENVCQKHVRRSSRLAVAFFTRWLSQQKILWRVLQPKSTLMHFGSRWCATHGLASTVTLAPHDHATLQAKTRVIHHACIPVVVRSAALKLSYPPWRAIQLHASPLNPRNVVVNK